MHQIDEIQFVIPNLLISSPPFTSELSDLSCPALEKLLTWSTCKTMGPYHRAEAIQQCFYLKNSKIPEGVLGAHCHQLANFSDGYWLRADFVQYYVDHKGVYLLGNENLNLTLKEKKSLLLTLNEFLKEDGLTLSFVNPQEGYVHFLAPTTITTNPLPESIGKEIKNLLPSGEDQAYWRKLDAEIQMLLKTHPVNLERQKKNLPEIGGIWFWGEGDLPRFPHTELKNKKIHIISNDASILALAKLLNYTTHFLNKSSYETINEIMENGDKNNQLRFFDFDLQFYHKRNREEDWKNHIQMLEKNWFKPALMALTNKQIQHIRILSCDGKEFAFSYKNLFYFWNKFKKVEHNII